MTHQKKLLCAITVILMMSLCFPSVFGTELPDIEPIHLPDGFQFGTNLWVIGWGGDAAFKNEAAPGEYSMRRFAFSVDWESAYDMKENKPLADIWNPVFLEELKPYTFIRFIDWGSVDQPNVMKRTINWSDRRLPTDNHNDGSTIAFEWMIDLCNRLNKDAWICIPNRVNDTYAEELAKLFHETLKPNLKCYVEYSNETWNTFFREQHEWCLERGKEEKFTGSDADIAEAYTIFRSFQIFSIFEKIYGKEEMVKRIIRTSCSWVNGIDPFDRQYKNVKESKEKNPDGQASDILCVAPYVGHDLDGEDSAVARKFIHEANTVVYPAILRCKAIAEKYGLKFGAYESGQHLTRNADKFSANEEIYACYIYMFNKFFPEFDVVAHLNNVGEWGDNGAWGAKRYTGQPLDEVPKYRAIHDWSAVNLHYAGK